jgi:hypothetical protein
MGINCSHKARKTEQVKGSFIVIMQNFELNQRTGNEGTDETRVDRTQEAAFLEVQAMAGAAPRSWYIIDTGGSEVSALNDW